MILVSGVEIYGTFIPDSFKIPMPLIQIIHSAATSSSRTTLSRSIQDMWGGWAPEIALRDKIVSELIKRGRKATAEPVIILLPQSLKDEAGPKSETIVAAKLWYNPDKTIFDHTSAVKKYRPTVIIEAGYDSFYLEEDGGVVAVIIKVIDSQSQMTIGRRRTLGLIETDRDYNLKDSTQLPKYCESIKTGFDKMLEKEIPQMLAEVGL